MLVLRKKKKKETFSQVSIVYLFPTNIWAINLQKIKAQNEICFRLLCATVGKYKNRGFFYSHAVDRDEKLGGY